MTALAPAPTAAPARTRAPKRVVAASVVTLLHAAVTSYGAYYFSFVFEDPETTAFTWAFVTLFWSLTLTGSLAAIGMLRRSERARQVLVGYCALGLAWTAAKLVFWSETEALVFGVTGGLVMLAALSRPARRWTAG